MLPPLQGDNDIRVKETLNWRSIIALIVPPADRAGAADEAGRSRSAYDRSQYERLAIPYQFTPRLRVSDAVTLALRALLRIFLGSILFGAWGAYTLLAWTSIPNLYLRSAAMIPMFALFLALLAGMMIATARLSPRHLPR
jgi:hypothetical protein